MKIILIQDVKNVGNIGETKTVKNGFARNYLIPRNLALPATSQNLRILENEKTRINKLIKDKLTKADILKQEIEKASYSISAKIGKNKKMFGSITNADIAKLLKKNKFDINKKNIILKESIKQIGEHTVSIKLHRNVTANIKIVVAKNTPEKV